MLPINNFPIYLRNLVFLILKFVLLYFAQIIKIQLMFFYKYVRWMNDRYYNNSSNILILWFLTHYFYRLEWFWQRIYFEIERRKSLQMTSFLNIIIANSGSWLSWNEEIHIAKTSFFIKYLLSKTFFTPFIKNYHLVNFLIKNNIYILYYIKVTYISEVEFLHCYLLNFLGISIRSLKLIRLYLQKIGSITI